MCHMGKNIPISDDVYERLEREKGDRSFSDVIEEKLDDGNRPDDVSGQHIFELGTHEEVNTEIEELSQSTMDRFEDETA